MKPLFSIVTPSFRSARWLPTCIASVADQQGTTFEHIVQDSCSDDGTQDWLPSDQRVKAYIEKDRGMYDAVNRGFEKSQGDLLAWLNCDEQYLPGTLAAVADYFQKHPHSEVVFAHIVIVDEHGDYLCHRKVQTPLLHHTWTCNLSTLSCAMFFRRQLLFEKGFKFRADWRDAADAEWIVRLLRGGVKMAVLPQFTSVFTFLGSNMSAGPNARKENALLRESAPGWARKLRPLIKWHHRVRRFTGGMYSQKPFSYSIYTQRNPRERQVFQVSKPTFRAAGVSGGL